MPNEREIKKLSLLISEDIDEYEGLDDEDEFTDVRNNTGSLLKIGGYSGIWEYEELSLTVDDITYPANAMVEFMHEREVTGGSQQTLYSPREEPSSHIYVTSRELREFDIVNPSTGDFLVSWNKSSGFTERSVSKDTFEDISRQILLKFDGDIEYIEEVAQERIESNSSRWPDDLY